MSKKSFANPPQPKTLSPEAMHRFVQSGAGKDTVPGQKTIRLPVDMPEDEHMEIRMFCAERRIRMVQFARQAMREKIEREKGKKIAGQ